jgi:P4 family phage/plasmid primase-like protien
MTDFNEKQLKELLLSAISSDLALRHIVPLIGKPALDAIFYALTNEYRRNDGRIRDKWLKYYDPIFKHGGLAFYGYDPFTEEQTECISFKPNQPLDSGRKYEQPPNSENQAFYPYGGSGYWQKVIDDDRPIILTEGCKKALSAMSAGFPCVALTGVWNGVKTHRDENGNTVSRELIPSLQHLAGRKVYIAFDRDTKNSTIKKVTHARSVLAEQLIKIGCECYSMVWDSEFKGLDDLIVVRGAAAVELSMLDAEELTKETIEKYKQKLYPNEIAYAIAEEWGDRVCYDQSAKVWRVYRQGVWEAKTNDDMEDLFCERISQDIPRLKSFSIVVNVMRFARARMTVGKFEAVSALEYIPFKNGVWSFQDRLLLPHSQSNYLTWKLDRDYSPFDAKWHSIDKFFHTVTKNDSDLRHLLIAACGAVLHGRADLQQAFHLFGGGANGKGSFLRLLEMLVGDENTHSTSLEAICENKFETANLYGKRLTICPDEEKQTKGLSNFKKILGGDSLRGEEKGLKSFKFKYEGMVALASNDPVFMGDNSYGLSRRLIPIPFLNKIPKEERRDLTAEFKVDLPAFTTYLLNLDPDWITKTLRGANDIPVIKDLEWEMTIRTDSIAAFYDDNLICEPGAEISAAMLYEVYDGYCAKYGFSKKHINNFCPSLVNLLVDKLDKDVKSHKTNKGKVIQGLRIRTEFDPIGDEVTAVTTNLENKIISTLIDPVTTVTTVTAQTEKIFNLENSPKPPTSDRTIPDTTKFNDDVEYLIVDGEVKWLEIFFRKHATAKDWKNQVALWGCQTSDLKMLPNQKGNRANKWLLIIKGLTMARLEMLLLADLQQSPKAFNRG